MSRLNRWFRHATRHPSPRLRWLLRPQFDSHIRPQSSGLTGQTATDFKGRARVSSSASGFQTQAPSRVPDAVRYDASGHADTRREEADMARLLRFRRRRRQSAKGRGPPPSPVVVRSAAGRSALPSSSASSVVGRPPSPPIGHSDVEAVPVRGAASAGPPSAGDAAAAAANAVVPPPPPATIKLRNGLSMRSRSLREAWMRIPREEGGRVTVQSLRDGLESQGVALSRDELAGVLESAPAPRGATRPGADGDEVRYGDFARAVQWTTTVEEAQAAATAAAADDASASVAGSARHVSFRGPSSVGASDGVSSVGMGSVEDASERKRGDDDDDGGVFGRLSTEELLHREYQARERRLTTTLGLGTTPDALPAAGSLRAPRIWGEPEAGTELSTLPSRGDAHMARTLGRKTAAAKLAAVGVAGGREVRRSARDVHIASLRGRLRERLSQVFGSGASANRKLFLRFARTSDGSTDLRSAAEGLRGLGIRVSVDDVAGLVAAADSSFRDPAGPQRPGRELRPGTRIDFTTFARAVEAGAAAVSSIPQPYADESGGAPHRGGAPGAGPAGGDGSTARSGSGAAPHGAGGSVRTGMTAATSAAMLAHAASGLGHHDRIVRDVCSKIKHRIDQLGLTPSQTFLRIDAQRDGLLTHDEVRDGLGRMGVVLTDTEMTAVVRAVDKRATGIVDRSGLVTALFPPDTDVMEATASLERAAVSAEGAANAGSSAGTGASSTHRPARRMAPVSLRQSLSSAQVFAARMAERGDEPDGAAAGMGRSRMDEDFVDQGDLAATGADTIPDEWVRSERVDEAGIYTTERDASLAAMGPREFRDREFHKPPPHCQSLVPRDAHGTTAPFLARRGQVGEDGVRLGDDDGRDVGFAELAAEHGPLPTRRLAAQKKQNALLRRVFGALEAKGGRDAARRLFMRVNANHDAKVDYIELREGIARFGVAVSDPEFRMLMNRLDADRNGGISYSELARAMKQDDPLPDETDEFLVGQGVRYRPNRYNPPPGTDLQPGQGAPRVSSDSRGVRAAVDGLEAPAVAAHTLEEARMSQEVVDRMSRKRASLRDTWLRVKDAASSAVPASELRSRLVKAGVTVSDRQVRAFLTGGGARPMPEEVSFGDFCELSRPRAFVEDQRRMGRVSALQPRASQGGAAPRGVQEGIGRFGSAPRAPRHDEVPGYLAELAYKTNTDPAGIMAPDGSMAADERRAADAEARAAAAASAASAAEADREMGIDASAGQGARSGPPSPAPRRHGGVYRAAQHEHAGLPTAGMIPRRSEGRSAVAEGPYHAYRLWSGDRVRSLTGGGGGVAPRDDVDVGRRSRTLTKAEQRRRRRRHSTSATSMPAAGTPSGVFADLDTARKDLQHRAPAFASRFEMTRGRAAQPDTPQRRLRFGAEQGGAPGFPPAVDTASTPRAAVREAPPSGAHTAREPAAGVRTGAVGPQRQRRMSAPSARAAGVVSAAVSPVARDGAGRRHFAHGSAGVRDQHHSSSGIFDAPAYGDVEVRRRRMGSRHAVKAMGAF